jgi:hypothetical protein
MSMAGVIHTAPYGPNHRRHLHSLRPHRKQMVPATGPCDQPPTGPCDQTGTGGRPGLTPGGNSAAAEGPMRRSVSFGGGFILLDYAGRDAAALAQLNSLGFCPGPDVSAALPGC